MREHERTLCDYLRGLGATTVRVEKSKRQKHPRILFVWQGDEKSFVIPGTPGDIRAADNTISELRHFLGLVETEKRVNPRRLRYDRPTQRVTALPTMTGIPDGLLALRNWRPR